MPNDMLENTYAAVDLGSNSFHLLVVENTKNGIRIRNRVKQKVRLASGLNEQQQLDLESMQRGWNCLAIFAQQLQHIPKSNIVVVATATLRLAQNRQEFLTRGEQILGHNIRVISGEEEARLIFNGVTSDQKPNQTSLVIDIGGASTELGWGKGNQANALQSLNMGCVTWTNKWFANNQLNAESFKQAVDSAKQVIAPVLDEFRDLKVDDCLGASGTPQAIVEILTAQKLPATITLPFLRQLAEACCSAWHLDNLKITGLQENRRAIFPAGLAILIALFESLNIKEMHLAQGALREGVLATILPTPFNRTQEKVLALFRIDESQAHRVYRCCQQILANCHPEPNLSRMQQKVLQNACLLHEAGQMVSFKNHHQHSRYLIQHTNMAWLNFEEKQLIGRVVSSNPDAIHSDGLSIQSNEQQINLLIRTLRLAIILCSQRIDNRFIVPDIQINEAHWLLKFNKDYLSSNPLLEHLLKEEQASIKAVNWQLSFE